MADEGSPYYGVGFSIISYASESGQGIGWTYDRMLAPNRVEMKGIFTAPLIGFVSGLLDETRMPRSLFLVIERMDFGLPPMADLQVEIWGPGVITPGGTANYIVEYRNDGVKSAENVVLVNQLPPLGQYKSSSRGGNYRWDRHQVMWKLGNVKAGHKGYRSVCVRFPLDLVLGTIEETFSVIGTTSPATKENLFPIDEYLHYDPLEAISTSVLDSGEVAAELSDSRLRELYEYAVELGFDYTGGAVKTVFSDGSEVMRLAMVDATSSKILFVTKGGKSSFASFLEQYAEDTVFFFDKQGGMSYYFDTSGGSFNSWGEWNQVGSILTFAQCFRNCLISKVPLAALGKAIKSIDTILKWKDCYNCATKGDKYACVTCATLVKDVPLLGEAIDLIECADTCGKDPDHYRCDPDKDVKRWCTKGGFWGLFGKESVAELRCILPGIWDYWPTTIDVCSGCSGFFVKTGLCNACIDAKCKCIPCDDIDAARAGSLGHDPCVKYGPEGNVSPGEQLNYLVRYENEGEGVAYGVYFTDTLDEDLDDSTLVIGPVIDVGKGSIIAEPGIYNPATRTITWFASEVGPGEGGITSFDVKVKGDAEDGTEIINYATIYFPSVPEVTRTNGIVSIVSLNQPPVANAGPDQTACTDLTGTAQVTLDGSASSDPDGDELTYTWTWTIDSQPFGATGVSPTVQLPAGAHTITLVVNDGSEDSHPDQVVINVVRLVSIDIYPNRTPNQVYLSKNYTIYVAVLGTQNFDAGTLDSSTVKFGRTGTEASPVRAPTMRDLNADGFIDAMYGFMTFNCGFQLGDTEGILTGKTTHGIQVIGRDSVLVLP